MKKRYLYALLFGVPGLFLALFVAFYIFGVTAGILWIFIQGDNPWPSESEHALFFLAVLSFAVFWLTFIVAGYLTGKKLEYEPALNKRHILISVSMSIAPCLIFILYQIGVGNLGEKSASQLCSKFCRDKGFSASGMPPRDSGIRECSCYEPSGQIAITVPLEDIM
jgi:hypothetical protein